MIGPERRLRKLRDDDVGAATTVSLVLMLPVLTLLLFAAVQAALWNHARTEARAMARATAALVARAGANPIDAERDAERFAPMETLGWDRAYRSGDLVVRVKVEIPKKLTDRQKELLCEFDKECTGREFEKRKGFLDKVKELFNA